MPYKNNRIRVTVPHKSGFDKSHRNTGSLKCGTLTPILCDEVIPSSRVNLKLNIATQLPPLVSDTYMNVKLRAEAFFVPLRLLVGSFESWFCDVASDLALYANEDEKYSLTSEKTPALPFLEVDLTSAPLDADTLMGLFGPGTLADYLGVRVENFEDGTSDLRLSLMPFIAYHLVYQEYYRNPRVQKPAFVKGIGVYDSDDVNLQTAPACLIPSYQFFEGSDGYPKYLIDDGTSAPHWEDSDYPGGLSLFDGVSLFSLRQRNFGLDYFTGARVRAQQGEPVSVVATVADDASTFSIAQLRAANSLQQFRERNNLPSPRLVDQVSARYGANLSDGVAQRPICIGSGVYELSATGVSQTAAAGEGEANPFSGVAAQYGRAYASGSDFIIDDFTANEPGYILVNISLVPEATYSSGVDPIFRRYRTPGSVVEMASPILQNVGDQVIRASELRGIPGTYDNIFGYTDRFADFMYKPNVVHGMLREGQSLAAFVLQRSFLDDENLVLSDEFLQIPTDYMDSIFAVKASEMGLAAWYDSMLEYHVSQPLAEYSIPSLQDPAYEHGKAISIRRNGQIF